MNIEQWFENIQKHNPYKTQEKTPILDALKNDTFKEIYNENTYRGVLVRTTDELGGVDKRLLLESTSSEEGIHGIIILLEHEGKYLIQAKPEVGYADTWALTATVQSSWYKLRRAEIPYAELFQDTPKYIINVPQDAGMFFHKVNQFRLVHREVMPTIRERFFLASPQEIFAAAGRGWVSEHLTQALGLALSFQALDKGR